MIDLFAWAAISKNGLTISKPEEDANAEMKIHLLNHSSFRELQI